MNYMINLDYLKYIVGIFFFIKINQKIFILFLIILWSGRDIEKPGQDIKGF